MTLKQWLENKWLIEHTTSAKEVEDLFAVVDRDLGDAATASLSADWRLAIAYSAVLQCAKIGLAASGYRIARGSSQHYYSIESMLFTFGISSDDVHLIDSFRKKRNMSDYERAGAVSDTEALEILDLARTIRSQTLAWLQREHPRLAPKSS
jgi:hypothetical protein